MIAKLYGYGAMFVCFLCLICSIMAATMDVCKISFMKIMPFCVSKKIFKEVGKVGKKAAAGLGSGNMINKKPTSCADTDIFRRFRNESSKLRCVHFAVEDKDNKTYMGQSAKNACTKAKFNVCIPKGGSVTVKGTTHMCGKKLRSGRIHYSTLKEFTSEDKIIPAKHNACDNYGSFSVVKKDGSSFKCWGDNCMPNKGDYKKLFGK